MPDLSASLTNIRADGYKFEAYISTPAETEVFSALVNQTTFNYPLTSLTIDTNVGSTANVLEDMELIVLDQSTTTVKGRLRIASGGTTSTVMQVNEFASGRINIANNDKLSVRRSWRVRDRMVGATTTFPKDSRIAYSDQGSNPQPVCNSGGHWVGFVDDGQVYATVQFGGSTSFNVDPDSGATVNHSWSFGDGTPSSSTSASPSVQFPVGERWISHTATDASNSKTTTQYVWVKVYDQTSTRPTDCVIDSRSWDESGGWRVSVTVPAGWSQTTAPDGALIVLWGRETYNGAVGSIASTASTGRAHIIFAGFLIADSVEHSADGGTVSFEAINPLALLAELPGFSQVLRQKNAPGNWKQIKTLTTNRAMIYLLRWGTTLLRTFDLVLSGNNYSYSAFNLQAQTPDAQAREIAEATGGLLTCDRTGRIQVINDPDLMTTAQRTALTTTLTITDADVVDVSFDRAHRYQYSVLEGRAFVGALTVAGTRPVLSLAPGKAPSEAPAQTNVEKMIVDSQTTLNDRTGRLYAKQNSLYFGLPVSDGTITLRGSYDVFEPAYGEWLKITLASTYNKRGVSFSSTRFVIKGVDVTYDAETGSKVVRLRVRQETDGVAGVTKAAPTPEKNHLPSFTAPSFQIPYIVPAIPTGSGVGTVATFLDTSVQYTTTDFNTYSPVWTNNSISMTGTPLNVQEDYFSTRYLTGSGAHNVFVVTTTNIYKISDIYGARTVTNLKAFGYTTALRSIHTIHYRDLVNYPLVTGFICVASNKLASGGVVVDYSTDNGTTWNTVTISTHYNTSTSGLRRGSEGIPCIQVSEHPGKFGCAYVGAYTATGSNAAATVALFETSDFGANWSQTTKVSGAVTWPLRGLYIPYHNNTSDAIMYYCKNDSSGNVIQARRNADGTESLIDPIAGSVQGASVGPTFSIHSSPLNRLNMVMIAQRVSGSNYGYTPYSTRNGGATWQQLADEIFTGGNYWAFVRFDDYNAEKFYAMTNEGSVYVSNDLGRTMIDYTGNLPANRVLALVGS